ncbi:MAG: translocation/assembly module TamB domain-containing protein [Phascolarctobacterium sp.]|nr:translocation/assembly module TamB domain-containing protein [Phascolarctobacterium sp.]
MFKGRNILIAILVALVAVYYNFVTNIAPNYIKQYIPLAETMAQDYIHGTVKIGEVHWNGGLSAEIKDITVKDNNKKDIAVLPKTIVHLRPWLALGGVEKALAGIELSKPEVFLTMDLNKQWNLQHFLKPSDSTETPFYGLLEVKEGLLHVEIPGGKWDLPISGEVNGGANPKFGVNAKVKAGDDDLHLQGLITTEGIGSLSLKTASINLANYAMAVQFLENVKDNTGFVQDLHVRWNNNGERVQIDGAGKLKAVAGTALINNEAYNFKIDGAVSVINNVITLNPLDLNIDGHKLSVVGEADLADLKDLKAIQAKGTLAYDDGKIAFSGGYDETVKAFLAEADFKKVEVCLPSMPDDAVTLNGSVAIVADIKEDRVDLQVAADAFDLSWRTLKVHKLGFDGSFINGALDINHFSALAGEGGSLIVKGTVGADDVLNLSGRMAEFPVDPFLSFAGQEGSGLCSTGFDVTGTLSAPEFGGIVQVRKINFMKQNVVEAHGHIAMKDNVLTVTNFIANMKQGQHILNGTVNLQVAEPVVDVSLKTIGVRAEPIVELVAPEVKLTGNVDNLVRVKGSTSNPSVIGQVCLYDGSAQGFLLDKVQGKYDYHNGQVDLRDILIKALSAEIMLNGTMTKEQELDFTMKARNVNLERLPIMASDLDLQGFINLNGHLGGNLTYPYFKGEVDSEKILVNGEKLTELSGSLESNGREKNKLDIRFKQPYVDDESNYGLFTADLNLNIPQKYMHGKVLTLWGNLGGILRMAKQDLNIDGVAQGELLFAPNGKGSGVQIAVSADDVKIHDLNYHRMQFTGKFLKGILYMDDVKLQEQEEVTDKGIITAGGSVDLRKKHYDLSLAAVKANPGIVTAFMAEPPVVTGEMDLDMYLNGTFSDPTGKADLVITNGSVSGVTMDKLVANLTMGDDKIKLNELDARKDIYGFKAIGEIPLDLLREKGRRRNPKAQMNIEIDLSNARLAMLPAFTPMIEWGAGETHGKLTLAGTLEDPLILGSIVIPEGSVKVADVDTIIDKIHADLEFQGRKVVLHDLSAVLGKGKVVANGSYALRADVDEPYSLSVVADNVELASEIFTGKINSNIEIVPQEYPDFSRKQGNLPAPLAHRPLIKGMVKLDDVLINMPTIPEMSEEEGGNYGMDLQIELGDKIHLFNKYLYDIWLSGNMYIKGSTNFPMIEGKINADKGTITYLRTPFKLKNASINWLTPGSFLPNVNLETEARFSRYDINMRVTGPLEEMDLQLSSNPPLKKDTIIRMLTLQREAAGSDDVTSEDMQNLMTAGLQMTVLGDVEMLLKQTLGLDQFRIYTGKVRSGIGFESTKDRSQELTTDEKNQYNLLVSKYLNDRFMAGYTTSFNGIDRSIFGQYDINKRVNITYSRSYDLSDEAEDWFGLEYKVGFN